MKTITATFRHLINVYGILLVTFSSPASAQLTTLDELKTYIQRRGQGTNPWCFAFAEEQVLKDTNCNSDNCQFNASIFEFSIFDIVKKHGLSESAENGSNEDIKNLFKGSSKNFPYLNSNQNSLRASKCTLEKELLVISRVAEFSDKNESLADYLADRFEDFKKDGPIKRHVMLKEVESELKKTNLSSQQKKDLQNIRNTLAVQLEVMKINKRLRLALNTLTKIAKNSADKNQFIFNVMNFTKCNDRVLLPQRSVQKMKWSNDTEVMAQLDGLLGAKKTVVASVCAYSLSGKTNPEDPCGHHAIAIKAKKDGKYLVVDSAFHSKQKINSDGSQWLPASELRKAIASYGIERDTSIASELEKIKEKAIKDFDAQMEKLIEENKKNLQDNEEKNVEIIQTNHQMFFTHLVTWIPQVDPTSIPMVIKATSVILGGDSEALSKSKQELLDKAALLKITTVEDLAQLKPSLLDHLEIAIAEYRAKNKIAREKIIQSLKDQIDDLRNKQILNIKITSNDSSLIWLE